MTDPFEYDVFISFSTADEEITKPIWQALCSNGLRVFWSDSTLKKEVGNSWFEVIEKSLERSRHMLLICSNNSMNSKWVQREYRAFFDYCYTPNSRRLIPILSPEFKPNNLPLFLRQLQVGKINDPQFLDEIIPILGGTNIEKLQSEIQSLREQLGLISMENESLKRNLKAMSDKVNELAQRNSEAVEIISRLSNERILPEEQKAQLSNESGLIAQTSHAQNELLSSGNLSTEAHTTSTTNESGVANKKSEERENSQSGENIWTTEQPEPTKKVIYSEQRSSPATNWKRVDELEDRNRVGKAKKLHDILSINFTCSECGYKVNRNDSICPRCKRSFV